MCCVRRLLTHITASMMDSINEKATTERIRIHKGQTIPSKSNKIMRQLNAQSAGKYTIHTL